MRIIDGGDKLFAVGLDWEHSHLGVYSKGEVRKLASNHRATHYVEHQTPSGLSGPEHAYGFGKLPALPKGEKREILSLSSVVASPRSDNFIFVAPLTENEAVFIGVLSGQPTAGCDFIGPEAQVAEAASRFRDANNVLQVYYAEALGKPDFLADAGYEFKKMELDTSTANAKLKRVGGVSMFLALSAVLILFGASFLGLIAWKKAKDEADMRARAPAVSPQLAYVMSRDQALSEYSPVPISAGFPPVNGFLQDLQTQSGGWDAVRTSCAWLKGSAPPVIECATRWNNRSGNFRSFVAQAGTGVVEYDDGLSTVITRQQITFAGAKLLGPEVMDTMPKFDGFKLDTGSLLQDLSQLDFKIGTSTPALVGAASDPSVVNRVFRLGWSLEGPIDLAAAFVPALPPNMTLDEAELSIPDLKADAGKAESLPRIKLTGGIYVLK